MRLSFNRCFRVGLAALMSAVFLSGCGGGGSGSSASDESQSTAGQATAVAAQTVSLSWVAPGHRINGEPISSWDIAGYIVSYGRDPAKLDQRASVDCQVVSCGYDVEGLAPGTWYFAVQTVDDSGLISAPSQPVFRTI